MAGLVQNASKKLFSRGVFPVFKASGVTKQELSQWIKLALYFENPAIKRGTLFLEFAPLYPELFQTGVCAVGFGLHAQQIAAFRRYWRHEYIVTAILGKQTADFYSGSPVLAQHEYRHLTADAIKCALTKYVGEIKQTYPPYLIQERALAEGKRVRPSNDQHQRTDMLKQTVGDGVPISRLNDDMDDADEELGVINNNLPNSPVGKHPTFRIKQCHSIELLRVDDAVIQLRVLSDGLFSCRALVRDLGHDLGCQAAIHELHLKMVGPLTADQALLKHELHLKPIELALATYTSRCHEYLTELKIQYPEASSKYRFI